MVRHRTYRKVADVFFVRLRSPSFALLLRFGDKKQAKSDMSLYGHTEKAEMDGEIEDPWWKWS